MVHARIRVDGYGSNLQLLNELGDKLASDLSFLGIKIPKKHLKVERYAGEFFKGTFGVIYTEEFKYCSETVQKLENMGYEFVDRHLG